MKRVLLFLMIFQITLLGISQTKIEMKKENGIYTVPCTVNGLKLRFIFDTGASDISISLTEAVFMLKNGYLSENDFIGNNYYQLANGQIQEGTEILIRSIDIGGHQLFNVSASIIHSLDAPLLLGQSALSRLGEFSFDYSKNMFIIREGNKHNRTNNKNISSVGCIDGDCFDGLGTYSFPNGDKYVGNFKGGKFNGFGAFTFSNGNKHIGYFSNGKFINNN